MKTKFLYLILLFHCFIYSCERADSVSGVLKSSIESVFIPLHVTHSNSYQIIHSYHEEGVNKLITYNDIVHGLIFFDLDAAKVLADTPLEVDGPNAIGKINSLYFHNSDSIFLYERGKLHIANSEGHLVDSFNLFELFDVEKVGEPNLNFYFKLIYNSVSKTVLFNLTQHFSTAKGKGDDSKIAALYINTKKVRLLPIRHTDYFKTIDGRTGYLSYIGFQDYFNGEVLYNFQYESSLYLHNLEKGKTKSASGTLSEKPSYVQPIAATDDPEIFEKHALENTHYLAVIPDKWRGLVYRFNWLSPNPAFENGSWTEKSTSISIFDKDLKFLEEYTLPDHTYQINNWFVNENGLYLDFAHPKNEHQKEDFLTFHIINFEK